MKNGNNQEVKIPLLHITDLYHPPQDPDDHIDLATVVGLEEFDLKGVFLDVTRRFLEEAPTGYDIARDPGFVPVTQLGYLIGHPIAVAIGPAEPLKDTRDAALDRDNREQAGISMVLDVLRKSDQPVVVSIVGSSRVLTAAFNRDPKLLRSKVHSVLLNAGATAGTEREWNVGLDLAAYVGLWRSGLPIRWYPCATETGAHNPDHERGTYWTVSHADLFRNLPNGLGAWFSFSFLGNRRGDFIRAMDELKNASDWEKVLSGKRNLWSTASLVMAAGRVLAHTPDGWRFVPESASGGYEVWPWRLDPIEATVTDDGQVHWQPVTKNTQNWIFGRRSGGNFGLAMAEALNALLRSITL
jgi:pyrimidine-specific ribonucleoside hydrolase